MADGTVESLRADISQSAFDALATANGGESVALERLIEHKPSTWAKPVSLVIFVASSLIMLCGAGLAYRKQARTQ
ncbi:MAG: hypothetical protein JXM70_12505 [Pirellulales bacterium]|nr:hypothetical protein [Pirellulales bacterium]